MAASTSQADCQDSKGKAKANPLSAPSEDVTPWNWTSLTDPSSGRVPPVFTKDGR